MADSSGAGGAAGQMVDMFINAFGRSQAEAEAREGQRAISNAYYEALGIIPPDLDATDLQQQGDSQYNYITEDPRLRNYQMQALDQLGSIAAAGGGQTAQDYEAYQRARQQAGMMSNAARGAAMNEQQQRGLQGGNAALLANLTASQNANNQANQMGVQAASDSRARYLAALNQLGSQSANVRGQDYGIASNRASAQDAINKFNTQMRQDTQRYNQGLSQQNFQNQMAASNLHSNAANQYNQSRRGRQGDKQEDAAVWGEAAGNLTNSLVSMAGGGGGGSGGGGFGF